MKTTVKHLSSGLREVALDLTRCARCNKRPRGKRQAAEFERYAPYCSYNCQEWARLEAAQRYISTLEASDEA